MFDKSASIQQLEGLSFRAQPALETRYYDGWLLRFADGYTRRANSVNPLFGSSLDTQGKIARIESLYGSRQQDSIFKLTDASYPSSLEAQLDARGYRSEAETSVQVALLKSSTRQQPEPYHCHKQLTTAWLDAYMQLNQVPVDYALTLRRMLGMISRRRCFIGLLDADQHYVALGLGVLDGDYLGLFDIITAPHLRRQGLAKTLVDSLFMWGHEQGARRAYLQVMQHNEAALGLYHRFGFQQAYRYWYRVRSYTG